MSGRRERERERRLVWRGMYVYTCTHTHHTHICTYTYVRTYVLNGKGFLPTSDQNAMVFFRTMRPEHSEHIGKVFSPFLAGIEEPFSVHATAS